MFLFSYYLPAYNKFKQVLNSKTFLPHDKCFANVDPSATFNRLLNNEENINFMEITVLTVLFTISTLLVSLVSTLPDLPYSYQIHLWSNIIEGKMSLLTSQTMHIRSIYIFISTGWTMSFSIFFHQQCRRKQKHYRCTAWSAETIMLSCELFKF